MVSLRQWLNQAEVNAGRRDDQRRCGALGELERIVGWKAARTVATSLVLAAYVGNNRIFPTPVYLHRLPTHSGGYLQCRSRPAIVRFRKRTRRIRRFALELWSVLWRSKEPQSSETRQSLLGQAQLTLL